MPILRYRILMESVVRRFEDTFLFMMRFDMKHRQGIVLFVLGGMAAWSILAIELNLPHGIAAPAPASPPAVSPNVNVMNTPNVQVVNTPTVHVQERNWQYRAEVIPKAFPGTPEWSEFVARLNGYGQQGWELVNIVESVALMKKAL
jgi:hypothetical protein